MGGPPGPPKECFLEVSCYIKPSKKHSFGCLGTVYLLMYYVSDHESYRLC